MGMNNIKVRTKLVIVMVIALIALALCTVISNTSLSGLGNNALDIIENDMRSSYDEQIKAQVDNVISLCQSIYNRYEKGEYTLDEAEKLAADGIDAKVINIHTIKPLDEDLVVAAAKECGKVVTVEEHSVIGGLGSAVCETLSRKAPTPVKNIGVQDCFGESGPAVALLEKYGLNAEGIYASVKDFV